MTKLAILVCMIVCSFPHPHPHKGTLTSQNYPHNYPNYLDKNYTIEAEDRILITFSDFELESHYRCAWDWIKIVDGDGSTLLPKTCGSAIPTAVRSHTNTVFIYFHSDYSVTRRGFKISWESSQSGCYCGEANRNRKFRIAAGSETEANEYPWMVFVSTQHQDGVYMCGGSLINDRWVVTAAHCVNNNPNNVTLELGQHNRQTGAMRKSLSEIFIHKDYEPKSNKNDIALLKLEDPVDFNSVPNVRPICLPPSRNETFAGSRAIVAGWGLKGIQSSTSHVLLDTDVIVISQAKCKETYHNQITADMLCTSPGGYSSYQGSCKGDSGGPLMISGDSDSFYTLISAVSWGWEACTSQSVPGVHARITTFLEWITETTEGSNTCDQRTDG